MTERDPSRPGLRGRVRRRVRGKPNDRRRVDDAPLRLEAVGRTAGRRPSSEEEGEQGRRDPGEIDAPERVAQLGRPRGAIVGHELALFHVDSPRKATVVIHLTLPGGAFDASGDTSTASWHGALAVSRGTGRFDGVGGTGMLRQFFDHSTSAFRLRLPTPS